MNNAIVVRSSSTPAQAGRFSADLFARFMDYCDVKDTTLQGYTVAIRHFMSWTLVKFLYWWAHLL